VPPRFSEGIVAYQEKELGAGFTYRVLSYLPLAHIFERAWVECAGYVLGRGHIFFAESLDTFLQDLQRARPTVFISVPRLWLKFQQGVFAKMPPKSWTAC
jgi:long-chain acyl-CoA synthetase